jgi:two-component system, chemotaxis family, sensor kinase Cph1
MHALLEEVLDTLRSRLDEAGVEVRIPQRLPVIACDRVRAGSVLQNLVANAIKYNDKPDPWIEIGHSPPRDGRPTVFHVRDNGIGIEPQHFEVIFRLFRRLHGRERYGGGTGAGLAIAKRLVERHGGCLWLESEAGLGTTFRFTLEPDPACP